MGKGDKKSKRGKIFIGSYGARRSRKVKKSELLQNPAAEIRETENEVKTPSPKKKLRTSATR
jgi:ribosomal small subunit protein bTHX